MDTVRWLEGRTIQEKAFQTEKEALRSASLHGAWGGNRLGKLIPPLVRWISWENLGQW